MDVTNPIQLGNKKYDLFFNGGAKDTGHKLKINTISDHNIESETISISSDTDIDSSSDDISEHEKDNKKNITRQKKNMDVEQNLDHSMLGTEENPSKIDILYDDEEKNQGDAPIKEDTVTLMKKNYTHPKPDDPNIQYKLYKKREYYYNKIPSRPEIADDTDYSIIKDYRDKTCAKPFALHEHQIMLSNIINPDTPYKGIIVYHGLGTGKCIHKSTGVVINNVRHSIEDIWKLYKTHTLQDFEGGVWSFPSESLIVNSFNEKTKKIIGKKINRIYCEKVNTILKEIYLETGEKIIITQIHKLLTLNGWTCDLFINDMVAVKCNVFSDRVKYVKIKHIVPIPYNDYVYDFEIEGTHNYFANNVLCHNTCVGIAIAEKFKPMIQKYNTRIYVLVPGPIIKESWKNHLLSCTGDTYKNYQDKYTYMDAAEKNRLDKRAIAQALQYYKIMSYKSFYKRVLGEKLVDKKVVTHNKTKTTYRKNKEGEFERDLAVDRIYNLNNTLIIVDEAHNLTGNAYGKALEKIIHNSINLKVVLMSGTLMKNLGSDIIELVNFLRPIDSPMERDKIFDSHKNHLMDFKAGGLEYFKNMINGYVSHVRGSDPLTFAKRHDKGEIPDGLRFTKVIRCQMLKFQRDIYNSAVQDFDDALDRASEAVANMAFPGLSKDRKSLEGYYGREGLNVVKEQIKISPDLLNKKIGEIFNETDNQEWVYITKNGKTITGKIYKIPYLKHFSVKFYTALKKLNRLVEGKKGARTAFVYSNLVKVGIDVFNEILLQNGYLEYQEDTSNYQINSDTICYFCGKTYRDHVNLNRMTRPRPPSSGTGLLSKSKYSDSHSNSNSNIDSDSDSDSDSNDGLDNSNQNGGDGSVGNVSEDNYANNKKPSNKSRTVSNIRISDTSTEYSPRAKTKFGVIAHHKFYPATFLSITGKSSEESTEIIGDDKRQILYNVFNTIENKDGKLIKIVLGSKVMNEGISMKHVGEVHVLDVYFNLGKVDQVVGRAIRWCSHYKLMDNNNIWPYVNVFKYVVSLGVSSKDGLSSEEELYKKAEMKYILINKIERAIKERSFDCPLNINGNIFNEEVKKYEKCDIHGDQMCPAICNYTKCDYKCDDPQLNYEYYDSSRKIYKIVSKNDIDYSTFTHGLAESEINYAKNKIKNMYITTPVYMLKDIVDYIRNTYDVEKRDLFDEFFVYKALDSMIPISENDFNNFKDIIVDKNNTQGYLIYRDNYYIFQPFAQPEDVPLYYRVNNPQDIRHELSLYTYLKNSDSYKKIKDNNKKIKDKTSTDHIMEDVNIYNFDDTHEYYDSRIENDIVGIIDKEMTRRKNKRVDEVKDVFKIRDKLPVVLNKKRGTGIPSLKGAVCATSKSKEYLDAIAKKYGADITPNMTRVDVCDAIELKMLEKEKYSTDKDKNKMTYIRIPANHPKYPFPYNLEDRIKYLIGKIRTEIKHTIDITVTKGSVKSGINKGKPFYSIVIKKNPKLTEYLEALKKFGAIAEKNTYVINVE